MELDYDGGVPTVGVQEGGEEMARKLLRVLVVLMVSSVRSKRGWSGGSAVSRTAAEEKNTGECREGRTEAQRSQLKGGELQRVKAKLWEGPSWIRKGWGGLPTVSRTRRRRRAGGDGGSGARGEMRMQERAKWTSKGGWGRHARALAMMVVGCRPGRARAEAGRRGARGRRPEEKS
jgi:hypothetical protein